MTPGTQLAPASPDAVLRALADPHRRQILRIVQHDELPAGQIGASFTLTQQAVSLHIAVLKQAGLLTERRDGTRRFYALHPESLQPVRELLSEFWPDALGHLKKAVESAHPPTAEEAAMSAEIQGDVIVATEHINAPPELVFPYFTDPALMITWIGLRAELDAQPGGTFSLNMGEVVARGAYLIVDPPHRVVFTWGIPGNDTLAPGGSTVEVVLTPDGENTTVVLTHRGLPPAHIGYHRAGWVHRLGLLSQATGSARS